MLSLFVASGLPTPNSRDPPLVVQHGVVSDPERQGYAPCPYPLTQQIGNLLGVLAPGSDPSPRPLSAARLLKTVRSVLLGCPEEEVVWIHTRPVVAGVADVMPSRNLPVEMLV